jgi:N-acylneuraminate cytidylyltransferase
MRPTRLALDDTKDFPVFAHALNWLNDNEAWVPDIIVHLRPTHPFRKTSDIDKGIKMLISDERADAVWSVGVPPVTPYKMFRTTKEGYLKPILKLGKKGDSYTWPRQKLPKAYNHYGQVDVVRYGTVMNKKSMSGKNILPLFLDDRQLVDIDSLLDWDFAEYLLRKGCITDEY